MANASIYGNLLAQPKSAQDYANEFNALAMQREQMEAAKDNRAKNALLMRQAQQEFDDDQAVRRTLSGLPQTSTVDDRVSALRATGIPGAFKQADALQAAQLKAQKEQADIGKTQAETQSKEAERLKLVHGEVKGSLGAVYANPTRETALSAIGRIEQVYGVNLDPYRQELASLQTPEQIKTWAQGHAIAADKQADMLQKQLEFQLKANNELIGPDGNVNQKVLGARSNIARSGASSVMINTGQRGLDNEFKLRGEFKSEPVYKAHQEMTSAYGQIQQAIGQASPAGDLAAATKIMKLLDPGSVVRESELGMAMQASGLMDRVTNYASNVVNGTKLTPKQRQDFQNLADALYQTSVNQYNNKRTEYQKLGSEYGLNADRAIGPVSPMPEKKAAAQPAAASDVDSLVNKYRSK